MKKRADLRDEVTGALEGGHVQPWFQPQISTDTGRVTGFEALARWIHPHRGAISPAEFLPAIEEAGLLERLAEIMTYHTLTAIKAWDSAGVVVPQVGVNFSGLGPVRPAPRPPHGRDPRNRRHGHGRRYDCTQHQGVVGNGVPHRSG